MGQVMRLCLTPSQEDSSQNVAPLTCPTLPHSPLPIQWPAAPRSSDASSVQGGWLGSTTTFAGVTVGQRVGRVGLKDIPPPTGYDTVGCHQPADTRPAAATCPAVATCPALASLPLSPSLPHTGSRPTQGPASHLCTLLLATPSLPFRPASSLQAGEILHAKLPWQIVQHRWADGGTPVGTVPAGKGCPLT